MEPRVVRTIAEVRSLSRSWRHQHLTVGLVPTMGALHRGHLSLVRSALADSKGVVVSIFVNPLQFGPGEDLARYPRQLEADVAMLAEVDPAIVVFAPSVDEMYPEGSTTRVVAGDVGEAFEGAFRPGHFDGVATVVAKLFHAVEPDRAYFGQKDAQQLAVIRRMVRDLNFGLELVARPTVREPDGLALSSRNRYLSAAGRSTAPVLYRALAAANAAWSGPTSSGAARQAMREVLDAEAGIEVDYAEVVDPDRFEPGGSLAIIAVRLEGVRLIDNHLLGLPLEGPGQKASPT